jgi:hypothetical protein
MRRKDKKEEKIVEKRRKGRIIIIWEGTKRVGKLQKMLAMLSKFMKHDLDGLFILGLWQTHVNSN